MVPDFEITLPWTLLISHEAFTLLAEVAPNSLAEIFFLLSDFGL